MGRFWHGETEGCGYPRCGDHSKGGGGGGGGV